MHMLTIRHNVPPPVLHVPKDWPIAPRGKAPNKGTHSPRPQPLVHNANHRRGLTRSSMSDKTFCLLGTPHGRLNC